MIFLHVTSDGITAFAYFCIPLVLYYMFKKRPDIPYKSVIFLFALFILSCGTTHLMEIVTLWYPVYWLSGFIKAVTAIVSTLTLLVLIRLIPQILSLRGPAELEQINAQLKIEITERKRVEQELLKAVEHKSAFLANMSHEIRTPLNGILGLTSTVLDSDISEDNRKSLSFVRKSGEHLFSLLNDILDFSKIEAGKLEFESLAFNLHEFLADTIEMNRAVALQKGLRLKLSFENSLTEQIQADPTRLRQILNNLLNNAIKFTTSGEIELKVKEVPNDISARTNKIRLVFQVIDPGIGISAEKQQEIFNSFSQSDISTSRKYGGTGLGLTISKKLVVLMGGQITVQSQLDQGSTFTFDLLVTKSEMAASSKPKKMIEIHSIDKVIRVLVAEDNAINQIVTGKMLQKMGLEPDFVANGQEALDVLEHDNYDLILMDCQMPEMDGYEATEQIRAKEKSTGQHVKIIAMTASAMQGDREKCLACGMDDYVTKPLSLADLYQVIKKNMNV